MPNARDTALFLTLPSSRICSRSASRDNGRHRFKRARLPLFHFSQHFIGEGRNEIRRDFKSVQLEQMPANLTHAHPTCIHADHMILKARQAPLIFGNERRLKRGKPVSRNIQRSITRRRDHGLRAAAVAVIVGFPWRSVALNDGSVQPPASAPPTVSSVGLPDLIRLTATLHLCSVPGSAMGLSVHLKIFCCSEFAVCLSSSCRSCEFLLFIFT